MVNLISRSGVITYNAATGSDIPSSKTVNSPDGEGDLYERKLASIVSNYFRGALNPLLGEAWTQVEGKDLVGRDVPKGLVGRSLHAAQGLGASLFLQQVAEEMYATVPSGYAEGGLPGAAAEVGKNLVSAAVRAQGVGGGYYMPLGSSGYFPTRPSLPSPPRLPVGFR
jgi:hypothetical protein